jgi:Lipase maturation factor
MTPHAVADEDVDAWRPRWLSASQQGTYNLTRFVFLRFLGLIYTVAFAVACNQLVPLVGHEGILPADQFLRNVKEALGGESLVRLPTLFWFGVSDAALSGVAYAGLVLSLFVLCGFANAIVLFLLWLFYLSIVQTGQLFWGYGWESLLLETGFLAMLLAPPLDPRPFTKKESPPRVLIWLLWWLVFRLMLGAGLIKLRGDVCWRDLTCLVTHYETQPLPNPLSPYLHHLPLWVHKASVLFNHYAELVAPFLLLLPRRFRHVGALSIIAFQLLLIASGNLSWLNWLTITIALACFDDRAWLRVCPAKWRSKLEGLAVARPMSKARRRTVYTYAVIVALLSLNPVLNMLSPSQRMNSSFDPLYLVNTYGAFGSVGRERYEILLEGTSDDDPENAAWLAYEFRCKPGRVDRRPCVVAPYQYRIDWQMWFAAMSDIRRDPWVAHLVYKLLLGRAATLSLLAENPFPSRPPKYIRAELYRYEFTPLGGLGGAYWKRTRAGTFLPAVSAFDPGLLDFLDRYGWLGEPPP